MIYIHWLGILIYIIVIAAAMIAVLMDRRQPAKTMAWILVLTFLPMVGIVLYFFFGQNTRKERFISQQSLDRLTKRSMLEFVEQRNLTLPETYHPLIHLFVNQGWALPFQDNAVDIYTSGYEFFPELLSAIGQAKSHIHIDTYIIEDDPLGRLVSDALIDKAREGLEVRLIYDDVGCWKVSNRFFEHLREGGVEVHPFMPVKFPAFTSKVNYRNHRKICVIDGSIGFIGGMNIAKRYVGDWRDTHMKIIGAAVYALQRAFLVDWYFVDRTLITNRKYYPEQSFLDRQEARSKKQEVQVEKQETTVENISNLKSQSLIQVVTSNPTSTWAEIEQGYVRILLEAKHYVYIETPYFLPTEPILFALRTAALSGIDVRLMVPLHVDAKLVEWASRSFVMQTIEAGVKVYFYQPCFNHSKLLICDDELVSCGSANVDFRSFENNFEANVFIYDRQVALQLKEIFLRDQSQSILLDDMTDLEHRPFTLRFWESLVRLLAPLL